MTMLIIGFVGRKRSGKTIASEAIRKRCIANNVPFKRHGFADPIRQFALNVGLTDEQVFGSEKETPLDMLGGKSPRQFMQLFGTEFGRNMIHDKFWIAVWMKTLPSLSRGIVAVDDVRFQNEADAIRAVGGTLVRISRPFPDNQPVRDPHPSETEQDSIRVDYHIGNDRTIEVLERDVGDVLGMIAGVRYAA